MSYPIIHLPYAAWKAKKTAIGATYYHVDLGQRYIGLIGKSTAERVEFYQVDVLKVGGDPNLADYKTNVLPTSTEKDTIEEIVSLIIT